MHEERKELLSKVDEGKRDFVKKLAIGSAYALPVMASFPLDSVRKSARAQGVYGDPAVVNIAGVPSSNFNPGGAGQAVAAIPQTYTAYWVITFDRPMNRDFKNRMYQSGGSDRCGGPVDLLDLQCQDQGGNNGKCNPADGWTWNKAGTKLYMGFSLCRDESYSINVILNPTGCPDKPFQDTAGNVLPRTEGCAAYCEVDAPPCDNN
jgi:hypothetical protein